MKWRLRSPSSDGVALLYCMCASRPRPTLSYDTVANEAWVPGKIGVVVAVTAGAFLVCGGELFR